MDIQNDESRGPGGGDAASKIINSRKNNSRIADSESESNSEVARPSTELRLVTAKQARRIVRAVSRKFDGEYPTAWLLSIKEYPHGTIAVVDASATPPIETCVGFGRWGCAWAEDSATDYWTLTGTICLDHTVILLNTLLNAIAFAIMPESKSRAEHLSWSDRFFELRDAILSLARRLIRPAERLDYDEVEAQWLRAKSRRLYVGGEAP